MQERLSNAVIVEIVYRNHHTWISQVAFNFTQNRDSADDLVQELYVYLMEMKNINKIEYNNTVNLFYIYKIVKSKFLNSLKQDKKLILTPIEEDYLEVAEEVYNEDKDAEFERLIAKTKHLLENEIHWYDSKLLQTYVDEDHSIASLHKVTGISKSSIWTSLNKSKQFIRENINNASQVSNSSEKQTRGSDRNI